jgi:hypothetical protein
LSAALAYDGYAAVTRLTPLSRDAGAELLAAQLGGPVSGAVSRRALELCGGNPLLLEQVATVIGRGEDVLASTQAGRATGRADIVLTRFAGVPKAAIRCAQAASVLGMRFRPELAAAVAQLNEWETDIALDALWRSGLVRSETEMAAEFVHPLLIAVGTAVAGGPPRRSQRAELPHWAPALGSGVEPRVGEWMPQAGGW